MNRFFTTLCIALVSIATVSCDNDSLSPRIDDYRVNNDILGTVVQAGDTVEVTFTASDNENLEKAFISLDKGNGFEDAPLTFGTGDYSFTYNIDLGGGKDSEAYQLKIPENTAPGVYNLELTVSDEASNSGVTKRRTIVVENEEVPQFNISIKSLANDANFIYGKRGSDIVIEGNVTAMSNLKSIKIDFFDDRTLWSSFTKNIDDNDGVFNWSEFVDADGNSISVIIPSQMQPQKQHMLHIQMATVDNKIGVFQRKISLSN